METATKIRIVSFAVIILTISMLIGWVFWDQELKYATPTPVPSDFVNVKVGDTVDLRPEIQIRKNNFALLHFFNFDCPCARFNMKEFERLAHRYKDSIDFFVVIQSEDDNAAVRFQQKYDLYIPTIIDKKGIISDKCGIYATPQAVILDQHSAMYFKGNYNKARFCTKKETRFVEMAIGYLMKKEPLPLYMHYAVGDPYGCSLPTDEADKNFTFLF